MNIGEHYIVTGNTHKHHFLIGEVVKIMEHSGNSYWVRAIKGDLWWVNSEDLVKAHQIYENGELKWVGPNYVMPCNRDKYPELEGTNALCKEIIYNRPSGFKIDDGVVIFEVPENEWYDNINKSLKTLRETHFGVEIEIGDQVDLTCFGDSRVRGEVIGIVDKRFEVEFRGCKGLFYLNELVKI